MVSSIRKRVIGASPIGGYFTFVGQSEPANDDHARLNGYPAGVGAGSFTISRWMRLSTAYSFGPIDNDTDNNWASDDPQPPAQPDDGNSIWWDKCNFLEDGWSNSNLAGSSLGLASYGSGRVRWIIADGTNFYSVQAWPATNAPSVIDDQWHLITQRRTIVGSDSVYDLLTDGVVRASMTRVSEVPNYEIIWSNGVGQDVGNEGLYIGCEKLSAINNLPHLADLKGDYKDLSWWNIALSDSDLLNQYVNGPGTLIGNESGLVSLYRFSEGAGTVAADSVGTGNSITLANISQNQWTP